MGARVVVLSAEIERSQSNTGLKSKEFLQLKETYHSLEKGCRDKDNEILVLNQKIVNIEKQYNIIYSDLSSSLQNSRDSSDSSTNNSARPDNWSNK